MSTYLPKLRLWPGGIIIALVAFVAVRLALITVAVQNPPQVVHSAPRPLPPSDATGWTVSARYLDPDSAGSPIVELLAAERDGEPCDSLSGTAAVSRAGAAANGSGLPLIFVGRGRYLVMLPAPLPRGNWDILATISRGTRSAQRQLTLRVER